MLLGCAGLLSFRFICFKPVFSRFISGGTDGDDTLSTAMAHILSTMEEQHIKRLITIGTAGILDI